MPPAPEPLSIAVPGPVRWIVRTLEEADYETWTVGGAVRDAVAGRPSDDWDLATRATPEEVRRIFRRTVPVGIEHGTVGVLARDGTLYEVTTFRRDVETFGRHAVVAFAETLAEDLDRRDFTINALAWHPLRNELFDPHDGAGDLRRGVLRTVGAPAERFAEDYLRVLRALRFAGRFGMAIEPSTWDALTAAVPHLDVLSPERVREELWKVLEGKEPPSRPLELYRRSGALAMVAPEIAAAAGMGSGWAGPAGAEVDGTPDDGSHGTPDGGFAGTAATGSAAWRQTLAIVDELGRHEPDLRLAALLGDVGTPPPREDDPPLPPDAGPAPSAVRLRAMMRSAAWLTRLRHSNARIARVSGLVGCGPDLPDPTASPEAERRWLARVGRERVGDLIRWAGARARQGGDPGAVGEAARRLRAQLATDPPLAVGDLAISGRDLIALGLRPGPRFGEILEALLDRVLTDPAANVPERLREWAVELAEDDRG